MMSAMSKRARDRRAKRRREIQRKEPPVAATPEIDEAAAKAAHERAVVAHADGIRRVWSTFDSSVPKVALLKDGVVYPIDALESTPEGLVLEEAVLDEVYGIAEAMCPEEDPVVVSVAADGIYWAFEPTFSRLLAKYAPVL